MRHPELLVPASSLEVLKIAVIFGADAVYIGGEAFGLRAKAKNFTNEEIKEGIAFAHEHGVKVYITANILAHNQDLEGVKKYFTELKEIKPDALIISDPGVFMIAKEICPAQQLFYRKGCKSGRLHPSMPLEICRCRGKTSGRVSAGL